MKIDSQMRFNNTVTIRHVKPDGSVVMRGYNFVTTYGKQVFVDCLSSSPSMSGITHIAVGTGSGQDISDVQLDTELERMEIDSKTASGTTLTIEKTFGISDVIGVISEVGLFNSSSGDGLVAYIDTSSIASLPINKELGDLLSVTWEIQIN
jgi:hypothetical protein